MDQIGESKPLESLPPVTTYLIEARTWIIGPAWSHRSHQVFMIQADVKNSMTHVGALASGPP